jgi:hypothetical protein
MRTKRIALIVALCLVPVAAHAAGPIIKFTLPAENTTPSVFGSLPFPCDLYFDQGQPGDGDHTLLNSGASIGLGVDVIRTNPAAVEHGIDLMEGFGTTTATFFFLDGPIDTSTLPASPMLTPSLTDAVFCADTATLTPIPIELKFNGDTRIPNLLAVVPVPGRPLAPGATYTCVVTTAVSSAGGAVQPSADWLSVRDGTSANSDADAIFDPVVTALGGHGVPAAQIAGMTVFTTQPTTRDLQHIRDNVLPLLPAPAADFTSQPGLVFTGSTRLQALLGRVPVGVDTIATGFYDSPRFQSSCSGPGCDNAQNLRFTYDGSGNPVVVPAPKIPFTVTIPSGTPPPGGWPVIIQQHGLGGQRDTVIAFAESDAGRGFASIGIDAAEHGYRFFGCTASPACPEDVANDLGGTAAPDGIADRSTNIGFLSTNVGFFQAFQNFLGIRDNFRQTYADLLSLVRLIQGHSIDAGLGVTLDDSRIFYMGHSLGGLMGSGFVPIETHLQAALLNATGGGLTTLLFDNSSIGAGSLGLVQSLLGLDPANPFDVFALAPNLTQMIVDPADGINSAHLLLTPDAGTPRNVIQVEDFGDQVVPNVSNEGLAEAAGLPLFVPYVQNLHQNPLTLALVPTPRSVHANIGGATTAAVIQNGPATHAASLATSPGTLNFVPEFAHFDEIPVTGNAFPPLLRNISVPNAGILTSILDWFRDVADHGQPGTFAFASDPNFNPVQNVDAPTGASTFTFFDRTVSAGSSLAFSEPTPDVTVAFVSNAVAGRITAGRSILGSTSQAADRDVPPGPFSTVGTPGFLPFFVTLQRELPGMFAANVTVAYSTTELTLAGVPPGDTATESHLVLAAFVPGACSNNSAACSEDTDCGSSAHCLGAGYTALPSTVDTTGHTVTATGVSSVATFAVLHENALAGGPVVPLVAGGGSRMTDCRAEFEVVDPTNSPFQDRRGRLSRTQHCTDGDATCDADRAANGTCVFQVAICFNQTDPNLPRCNGSGTTTSYEVRGARKPAEVAAADAVVAELVALGGTAGSHDLVTFSPPLATAACTSFAQIAVPAGQTVRLRGRAEGGSGRADNDLVKLTCAP